jgi:hypothetical protein
VDFYVEFRLISVFRGTERVIMLSCCNHVVIIIASNVRLCSVLKIYGDKVKSRKESDGCDVSRHLRVEAIPHDQITSPIVVATGSATENKHPRRFEVQCTISLLI